MLRVFTVYKVTLGVCLVTDEYVYRDVYLCDLKKLIFICKRGGITSWLNS